MFSHKIKISEKVAGVGQKYRRTPRIRIGTRCMASQYRVSTRRRRFSLNIIGNPTDKRVGFFKITLINELVRCDFLNQPKWSEWNERNEGWFRKSHRTNELINVILKNTTSLSVGFLLNSMIKPGFLRYFLGHHVPEFFSSQLIFGDTL